MLEPWLAYHNYIDLKNAYSALQKLDDIISFHTEGNDNYPPSANDLLTAWAFDKSGKRGEGKKFLQHLVNKNPTNVWAQWSMQTYDGKNYEINGISSSNENYILLNKWMKNTTEK